MRQNNKVDDNFDFIAQLNFLIASGYFYFFQVLKAIKKINE